MSVKLTPTFNQILKASLFMKMTYDPCALCCCCDIDVTKALNQAKAPEPQNYTGDASHFIAPFEVVVHDQADNCWVSFLGKVLDITPLIKEFEGQDCIKPLLAEAGKDISHWFDERDEDIRHYVHPVTGVRVPYCPHGSIPHVRPQVPTTQWRPVELPWWKNKK